MYLADNFYLHTTIRDRREYVVSFVHIHINILYIYMNEILIIKGTMTAATNISRYHNDYYIIPYNTFVHKYIMLI